MERLSRDPSTSKNQLAIAREKNVDVHLFALEQLFCSMCALCSSEMKVSGLSNTTSLYGAGDIKTLKTLARPVWIVLTSTRPQRNSCKRGPRPCCCCHCCLWGPVNLPLPFEFKLEVKRGQHFIEDPLSGWQLFFFCFLYCKTRHLALLDKGEHTSSKLIRPAKEKIYLISSQSLSQCNILSVYSPKGLNIVPFASVQIQH